MTGAQSWTELARRIAGVSLHPHGELVVGRFSDPDGFEVTLTVESEGFEPLDWSMSPTLGPHLAWAVLKACAPVNADIDRVREQLEALLFEEA